MEGHFGAKYKVYYTYGIFAFDYAFIYVFVIFVDKGGGEKCLFVGTNQFDIQLHKNWQHSAGCKSGICLVEEIQKRTQIHSIRRTYPQAEHPHDSRHSGRLKTLEVSGTLAQIFLTC